MIVETILFCQECKHQHDLSDQNCRKCGAVLCSSKNNRNVTILNIDEWWKFWSKKHFAVFTPKEEFTSIGEFSLWKKQKIAEYLSGDYHDVYFGKLKYI